MHVPARSGMVKRCADQDNISPARRVSNNLMDIASGEPGRVSTMDLALVVVVSTAPTNVPKTKVLMRRKMQKTLAPSGLPTEIASISAGAAAHRAIPISATDIATNTFSSKPRGCAAQTSRTKVRVFPTISLCIQLLCA